MKSITLFSVEFCLNGIGIYNRAWYGTEAECETERQRLIDEEGCDPEKELDGNFGCISEVESIEVELSLQGLLVFANNYAVDEG